MPDDNQIEILTKQNKEMRKLLAISLSILNSKKVVILKGDDEIDTAVDLYRHRLKEYGIL